MLSKCSSNPDFILSGQKIWLTVSSWSLLSNWKTPTATPNTLQSRMTKVFFYFFSKILQSHILLLFLSVQVQHSTIWWQTLPGVRSCCYRYTHEQIDTNMEANLITNWVLKYCSMPGHMIVVLNRADIRQNSSSWSNISTL